jgi:hypothetical protein
LEGYGHIGGKFPADAVLKTTARTTTTAATQRILQNIQTCDLGLMLYH